MLRFIEYLKSVYFFPVYVFTFLRELRLSEGFLFPYLLQNFRNVTGETLVQSVYPWRTFAATISVFLVLFSVDLVKYKCWLNVSCIFYAVATGLVIFSHKYLSLQIAQVFYGTFSACEVAYFTYIYAKVDKDYYQQVTSHTRAAILAGRATSGVMGQLLVSFKVLDYRGLNFITFGAMITATVWSLFLPSVKKTIYFHQDTSQQSSFIEKNISAYKLMWTHFTKGYANKYTIKWSVWWALATCGFIQVQVYMQPLWTAIVNDPNQNIYNGAVEAVLTILGFLGALFAGVLKVDWQTRGELALTCCSLLQGFIMLISSQTQYVYVSYICYIVFGGLYHLTITIASSEIAKNIEEDSYGLIFGINTFAALLIQTVLTLVVVTGDVGFALAPRQQYFVYGMFHVVLGFMYIIIGLASWLASKRDYRRASTVIPPTTRTVITF
ncbi:thiamine transporter 1-like isoform X2 [Sitophilus oryzae]|uniref:Thiamine transporter 1-like isoform X2 n=1 Tax=Sitophilus oryzae TaxID=7048 RepID=A0A6J2XIM0_SITOR|nr:thiamine transporter 1-like isoform X2 [Sitophilus oryzae]